jgi:hypothetical protein
MATKKSSINFPNVIAAFFIFTTFTALILNSVINNGYYNFESKYYSLTPYVSHFANQNAVPHNVIDSSPKGLFTSFSYLEKAIGDDIQSLSELTGEKHAQAKEVNVLLAEIHDNVKTYKKNSPKFVIASFFMMLIFFFVFCLYSTSPNKNTISWLGQTLIYNAGAITLLKVFFL